MCEECTFGKYVYSDFVSRTELSFGVVAVVLYYWPVSIRLTAAHLKHQFREDYVVRICCSIRWPDRRILLFIKSSQTYRYATIPVAIRFLICKYWCTSVTNTNRRKRMLTKNNNYYEKTRDDRHSPRNSQENDRLKFQFPRNVGTYSFCHNNITFV